MNKPVHTEEVDEYTPSPLATQVLAALEKQEVEREPFQLRILPRDMEGCRWNSTKDHPICRALARKIVRQTRKAPASVFLRLKGETIRVNMPDGKRRYFRMDKTACEYVNEFWNLAPGHIVRTQEVQLTETDY